MLRKPRQRGKRENASLTDKMVIRGGRPSITRECATDEGYGLANRPVIRQILSEAREAAQYDARFDYRDNAGYDLEPWQMRNKFR